MECYRLSTLKIRGFRGFSGQADSQEFRLDAPVTVIFGQQGGGKSSTLGAIAWCLFGDRIAKKSTTGIQERKGWMVRNLNARAAQVELSLRTPEGGHLFICRSDRKKNPFYYTLPDGTRGEDDTQLHELLGISLADYMSCVHLHQEVISALLIEEPRERKNAIDRLMGLTEFREFLDGVKKARLKPIFKDMDALATEFESLLDNKIESKRAQMIDARMEARTRGLRDFSFEGALALATEISTQLDSYAHELGLDVQAPEPPKISTLPSFVDGAKEQIRSLRHAHPQQARYAEIVRRRDALQRLVSELLQAQTFVEENVTSLRQLEAQGGSVEADREALRALRDERLPAAVQQRRLTDLRAGIVRETLAFLDAQTQHGHQPGCPVCASATFDAVAVKAEMERWQEEMQETLRPVQEEILLAQEQIQQLEKRCERREQLLARVADREALAHELLKSHSSHGQGDGLEFSDLGAVKVQLQRCEEELSSLHVLVEEGDKRLYEIEDQREQLSWLLTQLPLRAELDALLQLKETKTYEQFAALHLDADNHIERVKQIQDAISDALTQAAETRLRHTRDDINQIYRRLCTRKDFPEIEIDPEKYEVMAISDERKEVALRILNKGDINCAALSIFLALATSSSLNHKLGFIILDDPTQSLDTPHKAEFTPILREIAQKKQILIATSERDFITLIEQDVDARRTYKVKEWTQEFGPVFDLEEQGSFHPPVPVDDEPDVPF